MDATTQPESGAASVTGIGLLRIDHVGDRGTRPGRRDRVLRPGVRHALRAPGGQRGAGGTRGDARGRPRYRRRTDPTAGPTVAHLHDRQVPGSQRARIQQLAYTVADIDTACALLRERGVQLLYDTPRSGTAGSRVNFIHPRSAGGVLVELVEPAAG